MCIRGRATGPRDGAARRGAVTERRCAYRAQSRTHLIVEDKAVAGDVGVEPQPPAQHVDSVLLQRLKQFAARFLSGGRAMVSDRAASGAPGQGRVRRRSGGALGSNHFLLPQEPRVVKLAHSFVVGRIGRISGGLERGEEKTWRGGRETLERERAAKGLAGAATSSGAATSPSPPWRTFAFRALARSFSCSFWGRRLPLDAWNEQRQELSKKGAPPWTGQESSALKGRNRTCLFVGTLRLAVLALVRLSRLVVVLEFLRLEKESGERKGKRVRPAHTRNGRVMAAAPPRDAGPARAYFGLLCPLQFFLHLFAHVLLRVPGRCMGSRTH